MYALTTITIPVTWFFVILKIRNCDGDDAIE